MNPSLDDSIRGVDLASTATAESPGPRCDAISAADLYSQPVERIAPHATSEQQHSPCEVCGAVLARPLFRLLNLRFTIFKCTQCGTGSFFPAPDTDEIRSFYPAEYYGHEGSKFSSIIEPLVRFVGSRRAKFIARQIVRGGRVLDVGCGRGITLRSLADEGLECHGFEVSQPAVDGIDLRVNVRVAKTLVEAGYSAEYFDCVLIWHVLEHVPNPRQVIHEAVRILKPGGRLIVAVPNFSSLQARWAGPDWFHLDPPRHLFHFPADALQQLVELAGCEIPSVHHFSLRQNPFGGIQSLLNKLPWLPRNSLYVMLHGTSSTAGRQFSWPLRAQLWLWFLLLALPALLLSIVEALARSGATVHVVAVKRLLSEPPVLVTSQSAT